MYPTRMEPWEANLTTLVNFDKKWKDMLDKNTPFPTPYDSQNPINLVSTRAVAMYPRVFTVLATIV